VGDGVIKMGCGAPAQLDARIALGAAAGAGIRS
jgi:hypothetical protein